MTPNAFHYEQTQLAADYGKHVYVEKPIANTLADGKKMIEACAKAGVTLMIGHRPKAPRRKSQGEGADRFGGDWETGDGRSQLFQRARVGLTPDQFRWRGDDSGCPGGALMTMGVHQADTLNHIFGPIKTVFAFFNRLYIPAPVEDVTTTVFQFASGMLGYLGSNYVYWRLVNWMYIYGTEGNLFCSVNPVDLPLAQAMLRVHLIDGDTSVQLFEKGKSGARNIPISIGDPVLEEIDEFADCIRTGAKPETDRQVALTALAFIRAAIDSARTGRPASIER